MKKDNIFWGLIFLLAAVVVILNALGVGFDFDFWDVIFTIVLVICLIKGIVSRNAGGILFPIAFLLIIYDEQLNIEQLTPWPVLGAAILGTIGFSMIFGSGDHHRNHVHDGSHTHGGEYFTAAENMDGTDMSFETTFGSTVKNINSDDFKYLKASANFGAMKIYFQNAMIQGDSAVLEIHMAFAGAEIYIPKEWILVNQADVSLGGMNEKNRAIPNPSKTLILTGSAAFSGIEVYYV